MRTDNFTLFRMANDEFYQWENELFPNNTTPYSDDDRILWCEGFVKAKLQNTQKIEGYKEEIKNLKKCLKDCRKELYETVKAVEAGDVIYY